MSASMKAERIQQRRRNLEVRKTAERSGEMTENTVSLRETNKGIGIVYLGYDRRDFGRVSRQRAGTQQQRPLAAQKIISK
jgi:hypothetical protein